MCSNDMPEIIALHRTYTKAVSLCEAVDTECKVTWVSVVSVVLFKTF